MGDKYSHVREISMELLKQWWLVVRTCQETWLRWLKKYVSWKIQNTIINSIVLCRN